MCVKQRIENFLNMTFFNSSLVFHGASPLDSRLYHSLSTPCGTFKLNLQDRWVIVTITSLNKVVFVHVGPHNITMGGWPNLT
jgi:hypothetical protein